MPDAAAYDLIVLGAGPAGEAAATAAALLGKRVAVIERGGHVGGAAVNTGTLPSKTLRETAVALSGLRTRDLFGVDLSLRREATVDDFLRHERAVKVGERGHIQDRLARLGVTVLYGTGRFADPHTVHVTLPGDQAHLRGEKIVIAVGSAPVRPPGFPFEHPCVHDSDQLLDLHELPKSLAVVGAGVIGAEYACTFAALGVDTHLLDGRDKLLPFLDADLSAGLEQAMRRLGVRITWNEAVTGCRPTAAGTGGEVVLTLKSGGELRVDQVLICAGRASRTADLNTEAAGLVMADKGRLPVDAHYRTNVPHIYAVGDCIGFPALASTSAEQGRVAARHAFGSRAVEAVAPVLPTGIYTIPEVSSAGQTEAELRAAGVGYVAGRASYVDVPRGKIIGDRHGFLKLLFRADDLRLVGVHVLGEQATEVVHVGVMALMTGATADLFVRTCFNYPTLGELYKLATYDALLRRRAA
jgi:NAD(P) transhydrogenase